MKQPHRAAPLLALALIILGVVVVLIVSPAPEPPPIPTVNPITTAFVIPSEIEFHRNRGDLQAALYHIEALAGRDGWDGSLHRQAAVLWEDMGDFVRALAHWEASLRYEPAVLALRRTVTLHIARNDWGIAYDRAQAILDIAPNDAWALYYSGLILAPSDPASARAQLDRAAALTDVYQDVAQQINSAIGDDLTDALLSSRIGLVLANAGEWSLAENAFQQAAAIYYPFPEAAAYTGLMQVQQGKDGWEWLHQALELAPENPLVRYIEGLYWRVLGETDYSLSAFLAAISLDPTVPEFYAEVGNTYRLIGDLTEAEYWLQTALNFSRNDPALQSAMDDLYVAESYVLTPSELNLIRRTRAQTNDPAVLSANGYVLHILGDSEAGLAMIEEALERDPDNPRAQFDKARILYELDNYEEARPLLEVLAEGSSPFALTAERLLERMN